MYTWGFIRIISTAITAGFIYLTLFSPALTPRFGSYLFFACVNIFFFSHYILPHTTPRTWWRVKELFSFNSGRVIFTLITVAVVGSILYSPDLGAIFAPIHLSLSEVYSRAALSPDADFFVTKSRVKSYFRAVHFLFLAALIWSVTSQSFSYVPELAFLAPVATPLYLNIAMVLFATFYFGFLLLGYKQLFPGRTRLEVFFAYGLCEAAFIPLALLCQAHRVHWSGLVIYHVVFWMFIPFLKISSRASFVHILKTNLLPTVLITAAFALLYPGFTADAPTAPALPGAELMAGFQVDLLSQDVAFAHWLTMSFGVFHVLYSLILSPLNPRFLRTICAKDPMARA